MLSRLHILIILYNTKLYLSIQTTRPGDLTLIEPLEEKMKWVGGRGSDPILEPTLLLKWEI